MPQTPKQPPQTTAPHRSDCPITCTLELLGDKWSLLLIRDIAVAGKHRYSELENSPENIPTNILAERLKRLTNNDILEKICYQQRPPRYAYMLTPKGANLLPVLHAISKWALENDTGSWQPPDIFWQLTPEKVLANQKQYITEINANKR